VASTLSIKYQDKAARTGVFSMHVKDGLGPTDALILTLVQEFRDLSQAKVIDVNLSQKVALPAVNPAPADSGSYDTIQDQAILQLARADGTGYLSVTVPAPLDTIFETTGPYSGAMVNPASAPMVAWLAAAIAASPNEVLVSPQDGEVLFSKGWRKGQKHA
jgi:hypothetical protein